MRDYSFCNFLHELRLLRGLTQYQLGALVGVSDKAVSKWENGFSKPKSSILFKLSEVLEISVDELLTCKYNSLEKRDNKGVFAMKKQLWKRAYDKISQLYGDNTPIEITNRFLTEQAEMQDTDMIVYFDMLSALTRDARRQGEYICVRGGAGASFVAYLLGATDVNPLKPHYYCPECHAVIFDDSAKDGWDLEGRSCSCGKAMRTDGHNIPFETYRHVVHRNTSFNISLSPEYLSLATNFILDYFKDHKITKEEFEPNKIIGFEIISEKSKCSITLCVNEEFLRYRELERQTATSFERIPFISKEISEEFRKCNTDGITDFKSDFMKNMLRLISPASYCELIQISGFAHGTSVWLNNGNKLIENGHSIVNLVAYRDDVFNYIQKRITDKGSADTGFAYKVMEDTRRGIYCNNGMPDSVKNGLRSIGAEDWFIESICKIAYLFPKAHGVTYTRIALTLMWYKIHYPAEFNKIML